MLNRHTRREYLSEAFHSISQPLTGLQCGLELAVAVPRGADEYKKRIGEALEITARLRDLTAALRELVEAEDSGEDAEVTDLGHIFASFHERAIKLTRLYRARLDMQSAHGLNVYASEPKLLRILLFLAEQVLTDNSDLCLRAQRVNQNVEITIENLKLEKRKRNQEGSWHDQVSAIHISAAENYVRTLGGRLRISDFRYIVELPLSATIPLSSG